jgi:hypothetical protein
MENYEDKLKRWRDTERRNARRTLAKLKPMLRQRGFTPVTSNRYQMELDGVMCSLGIQKLRIGQLRLMGWVGNGRSPLLVSDPYEYKGHPSGLKFSFSLSRYADNSEQCASEVDRFAVAVVLPWFSAHITHPK